MSVQTSYRNAIPCGVAGGLYDLSHFAVDARCYSDTGTLRFGTGVISGEIPGADIKRPFQGMTSAIFDGIALNGGTTEQTMDGEVSVMSGQTVSVMRYGRAWVRTVPNAQAAYGKDAFLVIDGEYRGCFTTENDALTKIPVNMRFIGGRDGGAQIAPAELYNQKHDAPIGV